MLLFCSLLLSQFFVNSLSKNTVETLDLEKYQGRWYQIYGNIYDQLFEKFASCITADYTLVPNGNVSVLNSQYEELNGIQQIEGYAYYSYNSDPKMYPGELTVHLNGVPHDAPYWVYNLGPENMENNEYYDWAIVSDPLKLSLFVLARDVNNYYEKYDSEVSEILNEYGFDSLVTVSHEDCEYVPDNLRGMDSVSDNSRILLKIGTYEEKQKFSVPITNYREPVVKGRVPEVKKHPM
jgi:lipocalin